MESPFLVSSTGTRTGRLPSCTRRQRPELPPILVEDGLLLRGQGLGPGGEDGERANLRWRDGKTSRGQAARCEQAATLRSDRHSDIVQESVRVRKEREAEKSQICWAEARTLQLLGRLREG